MKEHPGTVISIYQVCKIAGRAYGTSFRMENKTSAFRATGLRPSNPENFPEHVFLGTAVTDISLDSDVDSAQESPRSSNNNNEEYAISSIQNQPHVNASSSASFNDSFILRNVNPLPRVFAGTKPPKRRRTSAIILGFTEKFVSPSQMFLGTYRAINRRNDSGYQQNVIHIL